MKKPLLTQSLNFFIASVMVVAVAPIIYFGQNSIFTVFDSLDSVIAWIKMLKDNGLLLALDSPTNCLGNMSAAYFYFSYNIINLLYLPFDVFSAHVIGYVLKILIGYGSMFLLLTYLFPGKEHSPIIKLLSISYALLPSVPEIWVSIDSVPLLCYFFCIIKDRMPNKFDKRVLLLLFFPILSNLMLVGFFLLCIWLLGTVILWLHKKALNINLVVGLFCLTVGYILVDIKLFYMRIVLNEVLNRSLMNETQNEFSVLAVLRLTFLSFIDGSVHAPALASKIILPIIFLTLLLALFFILYKLSHNYENRYQKLATFLLISFILLVISILFSLVSALYGSTTARGIINTVFPFLDGFNWGRFLFLNRTIFYILFALALIIISLLKIKKIRYFVYTVACLQIIVVLTYSGYYSYSYFNLNYDNVIQKNNMLSYSEFFAESLFEDIKKDLEYKGEGVAALGYHPSVLMFNGFSTIDGYNNCYPLEYALAFREIIEPQLELNEKHKEYYDRAAIRMYLYNDEVDNSPSRTRIDRPVDLHINTKAFHNLGGVYILSRAEIGNAKSLGLNFIKKYTNDNSVYEIFVYAVI